MLNFGHTETFVRTLNHPFEGLCQSLTEDQPTGFADGRQAHVSPVLRTVRDQTIVRALQEIPRPEIYFCYWSYNQSPSSGNADLFREAHGSDGLDFHPQQRRPWLIYCSAEHAAGRLKVSWEYSKKLHRRASIEQLAEQFVGRLRTLISTLISEE